MFSAFATPDAEVIIPDRVGWLQVEQAQRNKLFCSKQIHWQSDTPSRAR